MVMMNYYNLYKLQVASSYELLTLASNSLPVVCIASQVHASERMM